jgi:hypothetical protein
VAALERFHQAMKVISSGEQESTIRSILWDAGGTSALSHPPRHDCIRGGLELVVCRLVLLHRG